MAFVPNPNAVRVVLDGELAGYPHNNILHFRMDSPDSPGDLLALTGLVGNAWDTHFNPLISNDFRLLGITVYSLTSETAPVVTNVFSVARPGLVNSDTNGRGVAVVLTKRTGARGRAGRGRIYIGGVPDNALVDGELDSTTEAAWRSAASAFLAAVNTGSPSFCVYSTMSGGDPLPEGILRTVTALELRTPVPGSQRRRNHREATA